MDPQVAHLFVVGDRVFAVPMSRTDVGVWASLEPPSAGALAFEDAALGRLVFAALALSRADRPHPDGPEINHIFDPVLKIAGIRRVGEFYRRASLVTVERSGEIYRVARLVKVLEKGTSRASFGEDVSVTTLDRPTVAELGAKVREFAMAPDTVPTESRAR
jgi:hypothetical protein